ncbi:MAG: hypothetical protein JEZ09_06760 [Salinivirgaceae bacterium]|nr:hypothetical protein [Salinivirgaceae bacterium]
MKNIFYTLTLILIVNNLYSQDDPFELEKYSFVNFSKNEFVIYDSAEYNKLFDKFTNIGLRGKNKVRIVHIGDSHLQADFLSGNFRKRLQTFFLGSMGGRGFIFPYKVAHTNNPMNYRVKSQGNWENCRNIETTIKCPIGLSGITVYTDDNSASISIAIADKSMPGYDFDKLMVFHDFGSAFYEPIIKNAISVKPNPQLGYTLFEFENNIDKVVLQLDKKNSKQSKFNLYGFNFDSNDAGIIYHTVGINGAEFESYLKCEYFEPHLSALEPDWVIVSLGTNDAYTNVFDSALFSTRVDSVIQNIKRAAPNSAILLATPADHRFRKSYINENVKTAANVLKIKAQEYHLSYWDFHEVMGGEGSINHWYYNGMAHTDFLHFTKKGYEFQSHLLFNAFLKTYDDYLEKVILDKK